MTLALALVLLSQAPQIAQPIAPQPLAGEQLDPVREARVQALAKLIRCPVCQGLSIADSPSPSARAQLEKLRDLVRQGKSDEEIIQYFEARFGETSLLLPKMDAKNLGLWFGPAVLLLFGFWVVFSQVRRKPAGEKAPLSTEPTEDEYLERVRSELER